MSSFKNNQSIVISPIGDLTAEGIDCLFGMYGEIRHIYFDHDRYNQRICWLCYALPTFAQKAIDALDGEYISGRKISVDLAPFYMRKQRRIDDRSRDYSDEPDESDDYDSEYSNASSESEDIPESPPKARHSRGHRSPSRHSHHRHHHSHHYRRH
ncbi:hypothetical protein GPJ56_005538 [Histomonas meleagridis]|uniref:uncharacterized protein n=1 Tax=Histomonas meleagridis TaxID=135588 RepID=UPI00355AB5C0|nr:hypothetical protein GPJ56_005538 [Histomonas meleagridis]KAH0799590.1 hypothetical protein GO595_007658 [Histomonas meleagridis]